MYYLEFVGSGSRFGWTSLVDKIDFPWADDVEKVLDSWGTDVFHIYGLINDESNNKDFDKMICNELGIEPSDFTNNIHFLEVGADIWHCDHHPNVSLYYGDKIVDSNKLRKKIARALTSNPVEIHFCMEEGPLSEHDFLSYAMRLILEEEDND